MATAIALLFRNPVAKIGAQLAGIGVVELDATISETHRSVVEATEHPVERGSKIVDHLRKQPDEVTLEGLVSNTPITRSQQTRAVSFTGFEFLSTAPETTVFGTPGYAEEAFTKLRQIQEQGVLVTVATYLKTYSDMALISLDVPRDARTGDALRFSATFRHITIVENRLTIIRPATDPRANSLVKSGRRSLAALKHDAKVIRKVAAPWIDPLVGAGTGVRDSLGKLKVPSMLENRPFVFGSADPATVSGG